MKFAPKSEKEIAEENLIKPGFYDFEVVDATEKTSKSGNEMIELKLNVFDGDSPRIVIDYLLESMAFKLRHAADACGLLPNYEAGSLLADDFKGKSGKLKIKIDKDKSGQYADKNGVGDYVKREATAIPDGRPVAPADLDDSIPFAFLIGIFASGATLLHALGGMA